MADEKHKRPARTHGLRSIDAQIREAERAGAFENLPGAGKPLTNLDEVYDPAWWTKKLVEREKISMLPPALELRRTVEKTLSRIATMHAEDQVRTAVAELNAEISQCNATVTTGPSTHIASLDVDAIVEHWRKARE